MGGDEIPLSLFPNNMNLQFLCLVFSSEPAYEAALLAKADLQSATSD